MTTLGPRLERHVLSGLLLAAGLCCMVIAWSTLELERVNECRREQLRLLHELAADPSERPLGPIAELDGLYGRRVELVARARQSMLSFAGLPEKSK